MSNTDQLGALEYEQEASWCVNTSTFAAHRIPILDPIDTSGLTEEALDPERIVQQLQGGTTPVRSFRGGTFHTKMWLHGHGASTAGALSLDALETLMGYVWGNPALAESISCPTRSATASTPINGAGSTTTSLVTTASGTFARNSLIRLGAGGASADGKGSGQFYPVDNHTGTALALKHATITAAGNADVVYPAVNFYLPETTASSATSVSGLRMRWLTPEQQYISRGTHAKGFTLSGLNGAEHPMIDVEWEASYWDSTTGGTYPSAVTQNQYNPSPNAGGTFIVGDVGSTTRTAYSVRDFTISVELGMHSFPGHTGVFPQQRYTGARRIGSKIRWSFIVDAASGADAFEAKYDAGTAIWINNSLSVTAGSALGFWMQNCKIDKRPRQISHNGINSILVEGYACAGTSNTSTELAQAALVMGWA